MADRIVQLQDKDGNNIYPVGANPNDDPEYFTLICNGVVADTEEEFVSPKHHHYKVIRRNAGTVSWITSDDYDLSNIKHFRQTFSFQLTYRPEYLRVVGAQSVISSYMGRFYNGAAQNPLTSSYTGNTSSSGYWDYVCDILAVAPAGATGDTGCFGEASFVRQDNNGWQAQIQYHCYGLSTGSRVCSEIKMPSSNQLPTIYSPSANVGNIISCFSVFEILEEE